ncbi:hypothetical protein GQ53DRAFT_833005 [Thozetella sp. PMI_491]|nr:hypothetical protein GQ53DRAFT_833005 [Thozetella sp. PMI_491]
MPTVTVATVTAEATTYTITASPVTVTTCTSSPTLKKRTAAPFPTPDPLKTLVPALVSLACSCLSIPTPTTTTTLTRSAFPTSAVTVDIADTATTTPLTTPYFTLSVTPSVTITVTPAATDNYCPSPTPDTSCGNQGLQWAYYRNPFTNEANNYQQFDPTYFKTQPTVAQGFTGSAGGIGGNCPYSSSTFNFYGLTELCQYMAINYRGYLYAGQTGTYTIGISAADNIVLMWMGPNAYSGWSRPNAQLVTTYTSIGAGVRTIYSATIGEYIPIRTLFANGGGPFGFGITITAPDGTVILDKSSSTSSYLVQYPCDRNLGLPYGAFGSET